MGLRSWKSFQGPLQLEPNLSHHRYASKRSELFFRFPLSIGKMNKQRSR